LFILFLFATPSFHWKFLHTFASSSFIAKYRFSTHMLLVRTMDRIGKLAIEWCVCY
jgi:hypothetical protein